MTVPFSGMSEPLYRPRGGAVSVIDNLPDYRQCLRDYDNPGGLVAFDTERACGIRYLDRAYLVQAKAQRSPLVLLDPIALGDLSDFGARCQGATWVLHAAIEDLECMDWVGLHPPRLFDTQIAAKLLGFEQVGLGAVTEDVLGVRLAKNHTRENWSCRPLKQSWLDYAALDVDYLVDLALALRSRLEEAGRWEWACQEFAFALAHFRRPHDSEPWRHLKGAGRARSRFQLGVVRELFVQRDSLAREADLAPVRVLPNRDLVDLALQVPRSYQDLAQRPFMANRRLRRYGRHWWEAIKQVRALDSAQLPVRSAPRELHTVTSVSAWEKIDSRRAELYRLLKADVSCWANKNQVWAESALSPAACRRVAAYWDSRSDLELLFSEGQARSWQVAVFLPRFERICRLWNQS